MAALKGPTYLQSDFVFHFSLLIVLYSRIGRCYLKQNRHISSFNLVFKIGIVKRTIVMPVRFFFPS